jgi:hypothetical protein
VLSLLYANFRHYDNVSVKISKHSLNIPSLGCGLYEHAFDPLQAGLPLSLSCGDDLNHHHSITEVCCDRQITQVHTVRSPDLCIQSTDKRPHFTLTRAKYNQIISIVIAKNTASSQDHIANIFRIVAELYYFSCCNLVMRRMVCSYATNDAELAGSARNRQGQTPL